jgi:hypothetical protein
MSGEAGIRRADDHILDGQHRIQSLIDCLATEVRFEIDRPIKAEGEWWVDLSFNGFSTTVAWRHDRGFGIFTSDDDSYGGGPDEIYREPSLAAKRLGQLARRQVDDRAGMRLDEVRKLFDQPQTALAAILHKDQGFISRLERQNDALLSTVREYVEALGGEIRLVVRFDGFEAPVDLPSPGPKRVRKVPA